MVFSKKIFTGAIVLVSAIAMFMAGGPFGNFAQVAFADLYGASSTSNNGISASVSSGNGSCTVTINGASLSLTPSTAVGTNIGDYSVVKNVAASQSLDYRVIQFNNSDNTVEFEIWLNLLTGNCAILAL